MAECSLSVFPIFIGEAVCTGATEQEKMDRYCAWNTYFKDVFTPAVGTFSTELGTCTAWITEQVTAVEEDRVFVADAKNSIEILMGTAYGGEWNNVDDFTNKTTIYNRAIWVGIAPIIGEEPAFNSKWLFVNYLIRKVSINSDYTAFVGDFIQVDTTSNIVSVTLPNAPLEWQFVDFIDIKGTFDINKLIIVRNGHFIMGLDEDMEVKKQNISFRLEFLDNNWRIK